MGLSRRLIVFTRAPLVGQVKTRLIPALGDAGAARLHETLVRHCFQATMRPDDWQTELHCSPAIEHPFFDALTQTYRLEKYTQSTGDLGQRMCVAIESALERAGHVVLVGTDCPGLRAADVRAAFEALDAGNDAVIGPAEDGGYYLIGLRRVARSVFEAIPWGGNTVLDTTRSRFEDLGWSWAEVSVRWDVDRPDDLERLQADPGLRDLLSAI